MIKFLTVTGGIGDFRVNTWHRLVNVREEQEFLTAIRLSVFKSLLAEMRVELNDNQQAELIRSIKMTLQDTGLRDWPETPEQEAEIYRRMLYVSLPEEELLLA